MVTMRRCPRCGHPTRADRMVKGYGRDCAAQLGLVGATVDTGHRGPDLIDVLREQRADRSGQNRTDAQPDGNEQNADGSDACDGWDHT